MNQIPWRMIPERNRCDGMAASVEYDDGDPATIVPAIRGARSVPAGSAHAAWAGDGATAGFDLASVARAASVDYDDGDPATIRS